MKKLNKNVQFKIKGVQGRYQLPHSQSFTQSNREVN